MKLSFLFLSLIGLACCGKVASNTPVLNPCIVNGVDTCIVVKPLNAVINLQEEKQTMHSFGASDCWGIKFIGKNWPLEKRNQIADLLFSQDIDDNGNPKGIGLSMWRMNIGAGSYEQGEESNITSEWRREESFLLSNGTYDFTKQKGNQWFARAAKERGVKNFLLFSVSPPVSLTKNGYAFAGNTDTGKLNLKTGKMAEFADFLSTVTQHYVNSEIPVNYLSPLNEPQWNWQARANGKASQEGTAATNEEAFTLVQELSSSLIQKSISTKIAVGEAAAHNYAYRKVDEEPNRSDIINYFWNQSSTGYLGKLNNVEKMISCHSYFSQPDINSLITNRQATSARLSSVNPGINFWQSEYCILSNELDIEGNIRDLGINAALYFARVIHTDIAIANASSWQWWLAVSPSNYKDGLVYISDLNGQMGELPSTTTDGIIYTSKMLWALGNFSRFVRPDMIRVNASLEKNEDPRIAAENQMISAYKDVENKKMVVIVVNMKETEQQLQFNGINFSGPTIASYTTSGTQDLKFKETTVSNIVVPARSIVTFVGKYE